MRRREFLGKAGGAMPAIPMAAAPFLQATPQIGTRPAIKITDIKTFLMHANVPDSKGWRARNW